MKIGNKIFELRKGKAMTQEELAEALGVTRQTVSKWETDQTFPELDKAEKLSKLFNISLDELVDNDFVKDMHVGNMEVNSINLSRYRTYYEYQSKFNIGGLPVVHVCFGRGKKAKGIIAVGTVSVGIVAIGGLSAGLISFGGLSLGLLTAFGAIAVSPLLSIGGFAIGTLAFGGFAFGKFAIGGVAIASDIAAGGIAKGKVAIGDRLYGNILISTETEQVIDIAATRNRIVSEFPKMSKMMIDFFLSFLK